MFLTYAFCLVPSAFLSAQQPVAARIAGVVMTDEANSRPIGFAVVTLNSAALKPNLVVIADEAGRFVFDGLPAGSFTLSASKAPYLTMSYGQSVAGKGSGVPIAMDAGQQITGITLKLPRGAVISGRVVDERGQPLRNVPIILLEYRLVGGQRTLWSLGSQWPSTDSLGMYRAHGLPAGSYIVSAYMPGGYQYFPGMGQGPFTPSGGSTGADLRQVSAAEMQWAMQQLRSSNSSGPALAGPVIPEPPPGRTVAFVPAYYPGTPDPAAAVAVTVGRGEERAGIDFAMQRAPTARIEGRVVGADGQPATNVRMESTGMGGGTSGWTSPDGRFSLTTLLPGQYGITARAGNGSAWAAADVSLNGRDVTDLVLTLSPSLTIAGRVVFEGTTLQPPSDATAVRLSLRTPLGGPIPLAPAASPRADGTFQISGIVPGRYRLTATLPTPSGQPAGGAGAAWTIKSAMVNGRDAVDAPFEMLANGDISAAVITFTDRGTEFSGTLRDAAGRPTPGYYVVVFSREKAFWIQGSRRLPTPARSATDGKFVFLGLPPGAYYVAALTQLDLVNLSDEAFLTQLTASAIAVTLDEGDKKTQDLKLAGGR